MKQQNTFTRIYDIVRQIPCGFVTTYGQIALLIGNPRLGVIPCHRVVNRFGGLSPAFAFGGDNQQRILLEGEGVTFLEDGRVDMKKHMWYGETLR